MVWLGGRGRGKVFLKTKLRKISTLTPLFPPGRLLRALGYSDLSSCLPSLLKSVLRHDKGSFDPIRQREHVCVEPG